MEGDQDHDQELLKHSCKFCNKSFPCGRSLGGHMRSHANNSHEPQRKFTDHNLSHLLKINNTCAGEISGGINSGYGLRENPKRTWRLADHHSSEETSLHDLIHDKFCRECGRGFQSWKALFGHMKCHSERERLPVNAGETSLDGEQESWASATQKIVMDSQSDNEAAGPPSRRRRSKRRTRYMGTAANSSSVSDQVEQEQEEVAMCLMMLSRDVSNWEAGLNSVAESSDNNSVFLELKKVRQKAMESSTVENSASGFSKTSKRRFELGKGNGLGLGQIQDQLGCTSKRSFLDSDDHQESFKKSTSDHHDVSDSEVLIFKDSNKRSKFKCTTCDKIFHSYQALGGHRASHKKTRASKNDNINETDHHHDHHHHHHHHHEQQQQQQSERKIDQSVSNAKSKKSKGHECPICLKVFQSGQALGGHKRSHLDTKSNQSNVNEIKPVAEIREFLDLNLPAPIEDEAHTGFEEWWMRNSSHNHQEALVGLILN